MAEAIFETHITSLPLIGRGKVRDLYAVGEDELLVVATDRLSAFDVVLPDPIPGKGKVLTAITEFWLEQLAGIVADVHESGRERQAEGKFKLIGAVYEIETGQVRFLE